MVCESTLLSHVHLFIHQYPQVLLGRAALNPFSAQPIFGLGIAPNQMQDLALGFVELHEVCTGPPLEPVKVPLDGIASLQCVNHTIHLEMTILLVSLTNHYLFMAYQNP